MAGSSALKGGQGQVRTITNKEVLRFWRLAPCDVEAGVRRLKWAQTLVQNPAHRVQLTTALFGKLSAEQQATLGENGEISPDADPWAARWVADLRELEPFDERGVVQRMGTDVRALFGGSRIGNRLHCLGCHLTAPSFTGRASPIVGLPRSGGTLHGAV